MVANIESMAYVGEKPWHDLGVKLDSPPTTEEGILAAGLDWNVGLQPLFLADGRQVADSFATVRESDGSILGTVGRVYRPLQNRDAFRFFDPFLEAGEASLETAGSLDGGRRVWVMAKLNRAPIELTKQDVVEKYLLLSNGHDGTLSVRVGFTPVRVVCQNTLSAAHGSRHSQLIRVRHSSRTRQDLSLIRECMDAVNAEFEASAEKYRALIRKTINRNDVRKYVKQVFDVLDVPQDDISTRTTNQMNEVLRLVDAGTGNDLPGVGGTAWAAYNAYTEWLSHTRGNKLESRMNSLWFGASAADNGRALELALAL